MNQEEPPDVITHVDATIALTGADVRRYYDRNTWKFLLSSSHRAIHRELWGPGVGSVPEAVHYAHRLVLHEIGADDRRVLDLGCGVGTAGLYLARRRPVEVLGVTISPSQARMAERYTEEAAPLRGTVRTIVGDFTALPDGIGEFDLAFAIESFIHAESTSAFFVQAARALRPGGTLIVIDDFRRGPADDPRFDDVRRGWHAATLVSVDEASSLAADAGLGLAGDRELSSLQRLGRPRDNLIRAAQPLLRVSRRYSVWAESLVGGDAVQRCHRAGLLGYHLLRFDRR